MQASTKKYLVIGGIAAAAGLAYYFIKNPGGGSLIEVDPTFKKTNLSTLPEMRADLKAWSVRGDAGWNNKQPIIYSSVMALGDQAVKNMHALLWDIWQQNSGLDPYKLNWDLTPQPVRALSVGAWWENLTKQLGI